MVSADSAFFQKNVEVVLRPLLVVAQAVVGPVVREDGAVGEDAWELLANEVLFDEREMLNAPYWTQLLANDS